MNKRQAQALLKKEGQEQLLRFYDELSVRQRKKLLNQIETLDFSLVDLIRQPDAANERGKIEPLGALTAHEIDENREKYEKAGLEALKKGQIAAVLLAGGQGTRLGADKPKGTYNVGITKDLYIFECIINNILDVVKKCGTYMPLYVMTSEKNNDQTVAFFKEHNYFGYDEKHIRFFRQQMAPAVGFDGKMLLEEKDAVATSPNGNGGWFQSMNRLGLVEEMRKAGVTHVSAFNVDNVLQKINDPAFVGAAILENVECVAKVIRKNAPDERVGALCLENGHPAIVEYYELSDEMANLRDENGELVYAFGVISNYLFKLDFLTDVLGESLPVHAVKKKVPYIDENGAPVKPEEPNAFKFEQLILDLVQYSPRCLPFEIVREKEFAPIKNLTGIDSVESARALLKLNGIKL